jgi:hypothetical protein
MYTIYLAVKIVRIRHMLRTTKVGGRLYKLAGQKYR